MENFSRDISETLPIVFDTENSTTKAHVRRTHVSLPRLIIKPYRGRTPEEIPADLVNWFIRYIETHHRAPITLLPLPVLPSSPNHDLDFPSSVSRCADPPFDTRQYQPDPYVVNLPTPATLLFTENEAEELQQWRATVGSIREAHSVALDQLIDDPSDVNAKEEVRRLRRLREDHASSIARIHENRGIRRNFRKDFNHLMPGW
ncbi:hypothetical protein F5Y19DRAFT_478842 [Xylariaceae sp. FL1651]|nr:hypothetical protein F5Y19DRAFT_478842 [Xylariaceae sp. FL1651]